MDDKFEYFILRTEKDIDELKKSHASLHMKIDRLYEFRWKVAGAATVAGGIAATLVSVLVSILSVMIKK